MSHPGGPQTLFYWWKAESPSVANGLQLVKFVGVEALGCAAQSR